MNSHDTGHAARDNVNGPGKPIIFHTPLPDNQSGNRRDVADGRPGCRLYMSPNSGRNAPAFRWTDGAVRLQRSLSPVWNRRVSGFSR